MDEESSKHHRPKGVPGPGGKSKLNVGAHDRQNIDSLCCYHRQRKILLRNHSFSTKVPQNFRPAEKQATGKLKLPCERTG